MGISEALKACKSVIRQPTSGQDLKTGRPRCALFSPETLLTVSALALNRIEVLAVSALENFVISTSALKLPSLELILELHH